MVEVLWPILVPTVSLKRLRNKVVAKIVSSSYHPKNITQMMINEKGIDDVHMSDKSSRA